MNQVITDEDPEEKHPSVHNEYHGSHYDRSDLRYGMIIENAERVYASPAKHTEYVSPTDVFRKCILQLIKDGAITMPSDFACIFRLEQEMSLVGFLCFADYVERVPKICGTLDQSLRFNNDHIKKFGWGKNTYPNWPWDMMAQDKVPHYKALCKCFLAFVASYGFYHPSEKKG